MSKLTIRLILVSTLISVSTLTGLAQNDQSDLSLLKDVNTYEKKTKTYDAAKNNSNELQLVASTLFMGYKRVISSQDGATCAFHQTCSEYALTSVKRKGLIRGVIDFFDRFTRCNTCSPYKYPVNQDSKKFEDSPY